MVEYPIDEFAIIFNRVLTEDDVDIEEFVPVRVVEGSYFGDDELFVDSDQNSYSHMASLSEIGNVFAGRKSLAKYFKSYKNCTLSEIKERILATAQKYSYFKNNDSCSPDYNKIKIKNKETGEIYDFTDKDTKYYYELYEGAKDFLSGKSDIIIPKIPEKASSAEEEGEEIIEREKEDTLTPNEIIEEVKRTIKGQEDAIETITTILWVKNNFPMIKKTNMLVIGPSGVGKTAIFKKLREILDIPLSIYSITGNSQAGYKGHDIEEMLVQLYYDSGKDLQKAQNGIIIIDEFDKISDNRDTGEVGTIAVQNELLKLIEGCTRLVSLDNHQSINIDTTNILFVGCGAFAELFKQKQKKNSIGFGETKTEEEKVVIDTETIVKSGIIQELAGRLPVIVQLNSLTRENLKDILLNSEESYFRQVIMSIESLGIEIENLDDVVDALVDDAMKKNKSGNIGARAIDNAVMKTFLRLFNEIGNNPSKYCKVILGKNLITNNRDYQLVPRKVKTRALEKRSI